MGMHLAGDGDHRDRVEHRGRDAGDEVGRARARSAKAHADLARGARVAVGHVRAALLVAHQHMVDRVSDHGVVSRHDGATGVAEDDLDVFAEQRLPDDLGPGQDLAAVVGEGLAARDGPGRAGFDRKYAHDVSSRGAMPAPLRPRRPLVTWARSSASQQTGEQTACGP